MAKRFHCTGPIEVVVRIPTFGPGPAIHPDTLAGAKFDLGTCKQHPMTQTEHFWEDVPNDIAGSMQGLDKQYQGGTQIIVLQPINRFDFNVLSLLEAVPGCGRNPFDAPGYTDSLARGAYKQQNGLSFELWLYYTFFGTRVATAFPLMPKGIYYPCCSLWKDDTPSQGTKTLEKALVIEADWAFHEATGTFFQSTSDPDYF